MTIILDNHLLDALQAERDGEKNPVLFDTIWEAYGFNRKDNARRYISKNAESLMALGLLRLELSKYHSTEFDQFYLSVKGFKFTLARAKTDRGAEYLLHLLDIEERFLEGLERQLLASVTVQIADNTRYSITAWKVWRDSGIRDPYYVRDVIQAYYDYEVVNQIVCVTRRTYEDLIECFRAMDGAVVDELPPDKRRKFRHAEAGKMNRREPQRRDDDYGIMPLQLSLFDS